ncbi:RNase P subunit p30 [Carpediemonas membranifera]|uniref:RNase P subunit p30 n=1 Tax=Carpediemonas membranifera TaxID=201153 RepID=A0A8J6B9J6_9EUKA|nr:RNase P subunit p30 [Carpediemonas membranifera]|eukprot:KAG9396029.1 RNase P subunit p30 [Carpediemonas membranifera]
MRFIDLCISASCAGDDSMLEMIQRVGYNVVAFNTTVAFEDFPSHKPADFDSIRQKYAAKDIIALSRLTVVVEDDIGSVRPASYTSMLNRYDIVAARPFSEQALRQCIDTLPCDLISLPLGSSRSMFKVKKETVRLAVQKKLFFEVQYCDSIQSRDHLATQIANIESVGFCTRGKGFIVSSGAANPLRLRRPRDLVHLFKYIGLNSSNMNEFQSSSPAKVLDHTVARRAHMGVIRMVGKTGDEAEPKGGKRARIV